MTSQKLNKKTSGHKLLESNQRVTGQSFNEHVAELPEAGVLVAAGAEEAEDKGPDPLAPGSAETGRPCRASGSVIA